MSDDFYLDCETHDMAVHITDNKSNPPCDKELLRTFITWHGYHEDCLVVLKSDQVIEYHNVDNFKVFAASLGDGGS